MGRTPMVSIVMPTYNGAAHIRRAISSCLNQTYTNFELIVVDDGSTDGTPEIIRSCSEPRIKSVRLRQNQGHIYALNRGFAEAEGEFLTWSSDDNYYDERAIAVMAGELTENVSVDFVYAGYYVIDDKGRIQRLGRVEEPAMLDVDNYVGGCFLYRRKVYETIGDFSTEAFLAEDYEYWLRVRGKFTMKRINTPLYYYRLHEASLTGRYKEEKVQAQVEKVRERFIPAWKSDFLRGTKYCNQGETASAKTFALKSFRRNPLYRPTWRLLAVLYLNKGVVHRIRQVKQLAKRK